jgi:hypothetical protein
MEMAQLLQAVQVVFIDVFLMQFYSSVVNNAAI